MSEIYICPDCGYWGICIEDSETCLPIRAQTRALQCKMIVTDVQCKECGWSMTYQSTVEPA
jgi:hypothetical protein